MTTTHRDIETLRSPFLARLSASVPRCVGRVHAATMVRVVVVATVLFFGAASSFAQFGHPLKGQWSGEWSPGGEPVRLLLDIHWNGKEVSGRINPGADSEGTFKKVTIDYSPVTSWKVQIDAEAKDASGKVVPVRIDGTLENLGAYYRVFHGTWTQGSRKGEFTVTRN